MYLLICCSVALLVVRSSVKVTLPLLKLVIDWCYWLTSPASLLASSSFECTAHMSSYRLHPRTWKLTLRAFYWSDVLKTALVVLLAKIGALPPQAPALSVVKCTLHLLCRAQAKSISRLPKKSTQLIEQRKKGWLTSDDVRGVSSVPDNTSSYIVYYSASYSIQIRSRRNYI